MAIPRRVLKKAEVVTLLFIGVFLPSFASALTYQQDIGVNFTFNTALRLTLSSDIFIYNLAPGTASDSNIVNVNVLTNSVAGYTLNATVGNSTTYNTRNLVHSNTSLSDNFASIDYSATPTITTNTNLDNDKWAFSFSTDNGTNWSNYNGLPLYSDTENIATLKETNGPVASEAGDNVKFKIAAKAADTKVSGEYNNVINFSLAVKVVPQYTVQFNANGGSGTMPDQTIFRDEPTMLAPNSFGAPAGYTFNGWNTKAAGTGTSYSNQQSVTNLVAAGRTITLYARWEPINPTTLAESYANAGKTQLNGYYKMQDMTPEICSAANIENDQLQVIDTRDNKVYWIAKLADGRCWMTQNLDHDIVTTVNYYSYANTDIGHGATPNTSATWTSSGATSTSGFTWSNTPASYDPGNVCWDDETMNDDWGGELQDMVETCTSSNRHYHIGNYYNWAAAVAMNDTSSYTGYYAQYQQDTDQSICPAGWMLPKRTGAGSYYTLINGRYTSGETGNIHLAPVYFVYGGGINSANSGLTDVSSVGSYWRSVTYMNMAGDFYFDMDEEMNQQGGSDPRNGAFIRCVAR